MRSLPLRAQLYIVVVGLVALAAIAYCAATLTFSPLLILEIIVLVALVSFADSHPVDLAQGHYAEVTVSCALKTAVAIVMGPQVAIIISLFGTALGEVRLRRAWHKGVFNSATMTLTFLGMGLTYELLYDGVRMPFNSVRNALAVIGMILVYFLMDTGQVTAIVSMQARTSWFHIWKVNYRESIWNNLTIIPLGALMAQLWLYRPWSVLALLLPIIVVRQSFQFIVELQRQTQESLVSMADAIDQRDPSSFQHSLRVATISEAIADEMHLTPEGIETIRLAARLHDLGKIGMSNALLFKPGKFDEQELAEFRRHPDIGADMVKSFRLFNEGKDLIRYHHERYDGKGYPQGLAGEDIVLGSRILNVADSLDAMTSRRLYKSAFTIEQAVEELLKNKGLQFDPDVVDAFLPVLQRWGGKLPWSEQEPVPKQVIPEEVSLLQPEQATSGEVPG